jgi:hypothetical protein
MPSRDSICLQAREPDHGQQRHRGQWHLLGQVCWSNLVSAENPTAMVLIHGGPRRTDMLISASPPPLLQALEAI